MTLDAELTAKGWLVQPLLGGDPRPLPVLGANGYYVPPIPPRSDFFAPLRDSLNLERGTGSPTFTRATIATVCGFSAGASAGASQYLQSCAAGEARFVGARRVSEGIWSSALADGDSPIDSALKGVLIEPARTNLALQSNSFATTPWTTLGTPDATQNATGISGATNEAWAATDNDLSSAENLRQITALSAATYTQSIFVKKTVGMQASYPTFCAISQDGSLRIAICTIDTSNGLVTPWTAFTGLTIIPGFIAKCNNYNSSFWRVELTFLATNADYTSMFIVAGATSANKSTGTSEVSAQGSATFQGLQLELGATASAYIQTTTAAANRNADVLAYPTTSHITAAAGTIALQFTPTHSPSGTVFLWGSYVDASNYTAILHDGTNLIFRKRIAGTNYDATIANAFVADTTYSVAASWGTAGSRIALGATLGTPHANTTAAQIAASMQVGADGNSLNQPGAAIKNVRTWQTQLPDEILQGLSL